MYILSYLDADTNRYDVSMHTKLVDAEAQRDRLPGLAEKQIETKDTFNPKPV